MTLYDSQPPKQSGVGFLFLFLGGGCLVLILGLFAILSGTLNATHASSSGSGDKIGVVEIKGPIEEAEPTLETLHDYLHDDSIKAILVRVDSPGGGVGPSQEIYREIMKNRGKKPIVASMGGMAASGGYYVSCAAERVFANPGTLTGSIGVIIMSRYVEELLQYLKIETVTYKSGEHKDMLSPFRRATESDQELINAMIQDVYEQFLGDVASARKLDKEQIRPLADGRVLTGRQAQEAKLVDELGNMRDAIAYLAKKANLGDDPTLVYPKESTLNRLERLFQSSARGVAKAFRSSTQTSLEANVQP